MFFEFISVAGYALETVGVVVIFFGAISAAVRARGQLSIVGGDRLILEFRREFGRAIMLGLEFLIAGDIIRTVVVAHTLTDILVLGLLVLIRTVLIFTIHLEVEGRWPWQPASASGDAESGSGG